MPCIDCPAETCEFHMPKPIITIGGLPTNNCSAPEVRFSWGDDNDSFHCETYKRKKGR